MLLFPFVSQTTLLVSLNGSIRSIGESKSKYNQDLRGSQRYADEFHFLADSLSLLFYGFETHDHPYSSHLASFFFPEILYPF